MGLKIIIICFLINLNLISQNEYNCKLGGDGNTGNYNSIGLTLDLKAKFKDSSSIYQEYNTFYRLSAQSAYKSQKLNLYENELYLNVYNYKEINKFKFIISSELEHSYMRSIKYRANFGIGIGYTIVKSKIFKLNISEILLPEFFNSDLGEFYDVFNIRSSTRIKGEIKVDKIKFSTLNLIQPVFYNSKNINSLENNINLRSFNELDFSISKYFSFGINYLLTIQGYSSYINAEIKPIEQTFFISLKYSR
jgi:hypothetical protein